MNSNLNYLSEYQTFNNTQELNYHVKQHEQAHANELNATDRNILRFIARYSVKYSGASHLKVGTIAEGVSKSVRTIARVLKRLESLGIIRRIGMIRPKSGGRGASIIQLLPFDSATMADRTADCEEGEKATETTDKRQVSESEPLRKRFSSNTEDRTAKAEVERIIDESIRKNTTPEIVDLLSPYFGGSELYRYIGVIFKAKYRPYANVRIEAHLDEFRAVITDVIRRYKLGWVRNLSGYLYRSIKALARRLFLTEGLTPTNA